MADRGLATVGPRFREGRQRHPEARWREWKTGLGFLLIAVILALMTPEPASADDEAYYIWGAGVQMGAAHAAGFKNDRGWMRQALVYAIDHARASECMNVEPLTDLLGRLDSGENIRSVAQSLHELMQIPGRTALGLDTCHCAGSRRRGTGCEPTTAVEEHWVLVANGAPRQVAYDFDIAAPVSQIRVRVEGGTDDTGDGRVEVFLEEPSGNAILAEATGSDDGDWAEWRVPVRGYGRYRVVLRDLDTTDGGRYPGNGGDLEVILECEDAR